MVAMSPGPLLTRHLLNRAAMVVAALFYAAALYDAHIHYLDPVWRTYNFRHFPVDTREGVWTALLVSFGALFVPLRFNRPSAVFLLLLFAVVYVPTMVVTPGSAPDALDRHFGVLVALALGFAIPCVAVRVQPATRPEASALPGPGFARAILAWWAGSCVLLVALYGSIMQFTGEDTMYLQRAAGASTNLFVGYTQTYFANVLSPALLALGLVRRRLWLVGLGLTGCLVMYMINAQRTVLVLPVAIIGLHFLLAIRWRVLSHGATLIAALGVLVYGITATWAASPVSAALGQLLTFRTLAVPGMTLWQYHEAFATGGYTWWSHVRGISSFVAAPPWYAARPEWPSLGYFIGDWFYDSPDFNINAHLYAGDGAAAAGALGVVVTGVALAAWLLLLDRAARGWHPRFTLLVLLPVAITLTNGPLFTILLSFGGLFWTLVFLCYKPGAAAARRVPPAP
jgi:hypothetical protein